MRPIFLLLPIFLLISSCQSGTETDKKAPPAEQPAEQPAYINPEKDYSELFEAVQQQAVFPDSKTFVDCTPKFSVAKIKENFANRGDTDLKTFVEANFSLPHQYSSGFKSDPSKSMEEHIEALWPVLTRKGSNKAAGTLLPLPNDYIVPGGRFGEIYYWDSYFTMLGLIASDREDMVENMIDNFSIMIKKYGHIPNGNRGYFLSRSQPPFFAAMVDLLAQKKGDAIYQKYYEALEREYAFWMDGKEKLSIGNPAHRRVVLLGRGKILNRYYDDTNTPRPESYKEDVALAKESDRDPKELYRDLKAAAESGWDFSSRWFESGTDLASIQTTQIIPVDLNALLYNLEKVLAKAAGLVNDSNKANKYEQLAIERKAAILDYCWSEGINFFTDFQWKNGRPTNKITMAGMFPFFFNLGTSEQLEKALPTLKENLIKPGGFVTTTINSGEQWDAPNGWAPLQWIGIQGLRNYGQDELANSLSSNWIALNRKVYANTGKMVEKYNVEDLSLEAGGGEYPVQDGFGWSNGVALGLLSKNN